VRRPRPNRSDAAGMPADCWYAVAESARVGPADLVGLRAAGRPAVLFRTADGSVAALEDRCAHRPYPLSAGRLDGDVLRCGLCGFGYDATGACVTVPTQSRVPPGTRVAALPVRERNGQVWLWPGEPGRAGLHRIPELPWLAGADWASVAGAAEVEAGFLLLLENFADVTQVPFVAPDIAPAVLGPVPPPLEVTVTETTVAVRRQFPPAPLPGWQSELLGRPADEPFAHVQESFFLSPAAWVDHWDVESADGERFRLRFTQLVTPITERTSRLLWRVSRDFAVTDGAATQRLAGIFDGYYQRVLAAMTTAQRVRDEDGADPRSEVNVSADVAALKVREIVSAMLAEQFASASRARNATTGRVDRA
jgi:phenylpropionate dioxygenase-like ring-hydroxylating dioxygenase large terminal subunit